MYKNTWLLINNLCNIFGGKTWLWSYGSLIYNITTKVIRSIPTHGEVYSLQHYLIKFVSDLRPGTPVSSTNKTDRHYHFI